jgi:hypothetical protein
MTAETPGFKGSSALEDSAAMRLRKQAPQSFRRPHLRSLIIFFDFVTDDRYDNIPTNQSLTIK